MANSDKPNPKVEKILSGARQVFFEHGFGAATTNMVQRAAGVSKSTVYFYFPSKDALFVAVVHAECQKLIESTRGKGLRAQTIRETLLHTGERLFDTILAPSVLTLLRIVIAETPRFPQLGAALREAGAASLQQELAQCLSEAGWSSGVRGADPLTAARRFIGMTLHDIQMDCLLGIRSLPLPGEAREIVETAIDDFLRTSSPS